MPPRTSKVIAGAEALKRLIRDDHRPIVFTNGCFDILHRGHVTYLAQAAQLGKTLIVGINSDESVRTLGKGSNRPLNTLADRLAVIAALEAVDFVIPFEQETPFELIQTLRPDVLVKGGDWELDQIVGASVLKEYGGIVRSIPFQFERSTSRLIERIRASR